MNRTKTLLIPAFRIAIAGALQSQTARVGRRVDEVISHRKGGHHEPCVANFRFQRFLYSLGMIGWRKCAVAQLHLTDQMKAIICFILAQSRFFRRRRRVARVAPSMSSQDLDFALTDKRRVQMNRRHFIVAGSLGIIEAGCTARTSVQTTATPTGLTTLQERKAMPPFSLPDLDGNVVRSSDLLGSVAILRFWATW